MALINRWHVLHLHVVCYFDVDNLYFLTNLQLALPILALKSKLVCRAWTFENVFFCLLESYKEVAMNQMSSFVGECFLQWMCDS